MKHILVALCLVTILLSFGCGSSSDEPVPDIKNTDTMKSIREKVLGPGDAIDEEFMEGAGPTQAADPTLFGESYEGESTLIEEVSGMPYPRPQVQSNDFVAQENDPLTGKAWDDLRARIVTNKGEIVISFYHDDAPRHVENFVYLARSGFYDGLTFHRYVEGFVIQGGDPEGTGMGGPGYRVTAEIKAKHVKGTVAAARTGDAANPARLSSGSQYYICLDDLPNLDQGGYSVWGIVESGMDAVMQLRKADVMEKIEIF